MFHRRAALSWQPFALLVLAAIAGLGLMLAFARFNSLHEEFLQANFDSVHGARTLLKARHSLGQAEERLSRASENPAQRSRHLKEAVAALELAESYGAEGHDDDPQVRHDLVSRIHTLRDDVAELQDPGGDIELAATIAAVQRLTDDFEAAELERWGNLSSLNTALGQQMEQLRLFIYGSIVGFGVLMGVLAWALQRTRRAEGALRRAKGDAEAIQQTTLDAAPLGIVYIDSSDVGERRVLRANRHMAEMFGYPPAALVGLPVSELYPDPASHAAYSEEFLPLLRQGGTVYAEGQMRRRNGELFWVAASGRAVAADDLTRGVVWTLQDISQRKAAEAELRAAREKAETASRAKDTFLAAMSQTLGPSFASIIHQLEQLGSPPLASRQQAALEQTLDSTRLLREMVNDILDLSLLEAGQLQLGQDNFDPRQLLDDLARHHGAAAQAKGLAFALKVEGELPRSLRGDVHRLRQIADQLVGNAIKFTARGRVDVAVSSQPAGQKRWRLRLEVRDTGCGLTPEQQARIFEPLPAAAAAGPLPHRPRIGLTLCRQLAELMAGRLEVQSLPGVGSRFRFEGNFALDTTTDNPARPRDAMNDAHAEPIPQLQRH